MGKIVLTENVTLDGVTQDPTADEGFNSADWRTDLTAKDREEWARFILDDTLAADVLLLGRRTYDFFAGRYPSRTGTFADAVNGLKKYVVSTTLTDPRWTDTTVLEGLDAVAPLKDAVDGEIRVWGSTKLAQGLLERGLVDEVRLLLFPLVLGKGDQLLNRGTDRPWSLAGVRTVGENLALLTYGVARSS